MAARSSAADSSRSERGSGSSVSRPSRRMRSVGSTGVGLRDRTASMARLWAMVVSQVRTEPRRGSKLPARRQARSKVCWAISSARLWSPTTARATPNTCRWKRRTNASPTSGPAAARPASRASSVMRSAGSPIRGTVIVRTAPRPGLFPPVRALLPNRPDRRSAPLGVPSRPLAVARAARASSGGRPPPAAMRDFPPGSGRGRATGTGGG